MMSGSNNEEDGGEEISYLISTSLLSLFFNWAMASGAATMLSMLALLTSL
jgi:hypothetical protein